MDKSIDIDEVYIDDPYMSRDDYFQWDAEKCTYENITYQEFFRNHLIKNIPCIVKSISFNWNCSNNWVENNAICYSYLKSQYGLLKAPVADCNNVIYNSHCKDDYIVSDYLDYLENYNKDRLLYLKDWHLRKLRPNDIFYETPQIFAYDWLNEYCLDKNEDDFMFVYIGPKTSWTPLHADVYSSYSWSVNITGRKKWIFFPPGEEEKLKDSLGNLPIMFKSEEHSGIKYYEVTQQKGDAIFVPSGWYHQVVNVLDTISVNHNWLNGCNIDIVWEALVNTLISVECEIEQLRETSEFEQQCQLILKSLFGMDCPAFINFLYHIGQKRVSQLQGECTSGFDNYVLGKNQIKFDLLKLLQVLNKITNHHFFINNNNLLKNKKDILNLKNSITEILN